MKRELRAELGSSANAQIAQEYGRGNERGFSAYLRRPRRRDASSRSRRFLSFSLSFSLECDDDESERRGYRTARYTARSQLDVLVAVARIARRVVAVAGWTSTVCCREVRAMVGTRSGLRARPRVSWRGGAGRTDQPSPLAPPPARLRALARPRSCVAHPDIAQLFLVGDFHEAAHLARLAEKEGGEARHDEDDDESG